MSNPDPSLLAFLQDSSLATAGEIGSWSRLAGGVSSDIWGVSLESGEYCVKRALPQLRVAATWYAPTDRNEQEWAYLNVAERIVPGRVPKPIAHDRARGVFAMAWLASDRHRLWKSELLRGCVDIDAAAGVGHLIGRIHGATAHDEEVASCFANDATFRSLRIEPYFVETAKRHPALAERILSIAEKTAQTRHALVHGDVSPKNILLSQDGPVLIDAECASFGDPAFDLAFCLNHLIIKSRVVSGARECLLSAAIALLSAYRIHICWEQSDAFESRVSALLPVLALARVDGKSPLEYLKTSDQISLRQVAIEAILQAPKDTTTAIKALARVE